MSDQIKELIHLKSEFKRNVIQLDTFCNWKCLNMSESLADEQMKQEVDISYAKSAIRKSFFFPPHCV